MRKTEDTQEDIHQVIIHSKRFFVKLLDKTVHIVIHELVHDVIRSV